jgi:hypothetical protein
LYGKLCGGIDARSDNDNVLALGVKGGRWRWHPENRACGHRLRRDLRCQLSQWNLDHARCDRGTWFKIRGMVWALLWHGIQFFGRIDG